MTSLSVADIVDLTITWNNKDAMEFAEQYYQWQQERKKKEDEEVKPRIDFNEEKVKQDVWEENWKAMRLYSVVALVAFGVITLVLTSSPQVSCLDIPTSTQLRSMQMW